MAMALRSFRIVNQLPPPACSAASASISRASIPDAITIGEYRSVYFVNWWTSVTPSVPVPTSSVGTRGSLALTKSRPLVPSRFATVALRPSFALKIGFDLPFPDEFNSAL